MNVIKCYLLTYLYGISLFNKRYTYGICCKTLAPSVSVTSRMGCFSHMFVYIRCNDDVLFNCYHFVAVTIWKSCSMSLMRFNNRIFNILYYFIAVKQFFTMFQSFNVHHWNRFLTKIVNKAYPGFYNLKMVSAKRPKHQ